MMLRERMMEHIPLIAVLAVLALLHAAFSPIAEPFKCGDETRHTMTGVFVRDAIADLPASASDARGYATRYYFQYPCLGIIIWPPFFYAVEGVAMYIFGIEYWVGRVCIYLFGIMAFIYAYRLFRKNHDTLTATASVALLGMAPLVFEYCAYIMLEVPTLALVVGSIYHFERYLDHQRRHDAFFACLLAALAALTRFDGIVLFPFILLRLGFTQNWRLLKRGPVLLSIAFALLLTVPYYLFTWNVYGAGIEHSVTSGTGYNKTSWLSPRNFWLYITYVPVLVGWCATAFCIVGIIYSLVVDRVKSGVYFCILAAVYIMFVPLAEPGPQHAIYWVPALAFFAVRGVVALVRGRKLLAGIACGFMIFGTAYETFSPLKQSQGKMLYISGTGKAAQWVLQHAKTDRPMCYEGQLNGAFILAMRQQDGTRSKRIIRADKLLYSVYSDPMGGYEEYAKTDQEMLELLHRYDPEFVLVEQDEIFWATNAGKRLRHILATHSDEYRLETTIPFETNYGNYAKSPILIYRKLRENPQRMSILEIPIMALRDKLQAK